MCGIAGFLGYRSAAEKAQRIAAAMADTLAHRGPDDAGVWTDSRAGLALSHRRLSIIDLSSAGHQPMESTCGRYTLTYNGEIYNHVEIRCQLENDGVSGWRGHSDTETLVAAIAQWGVERTLRTCIGMFALAVWDRELQCLYLARDRMGEKPLYYGWMNGVFLFGSELKALRAHPAFSSNLDRGAVCLFLRFNYIPSPFSIYKGVSKLFPGSYLCVDLLNRDPVVRAYWSVSEVAAAGQNDLWTGGEESAVEALDSLLGNAVRTQSIADVPLGALLSGGIDSSLIAALMQARSPGQVKTFTIGFSDARYNEGPFAGAVANHLGTDHTEVVLSSDDALKLIPSMTAVYDEPFADSSQLPTQLVMRLARQHVCVALSGDGGDELFGGYNRHRLVPALWNKMSRIPQSLRKRIGSTFLLLQPEQWDALLNKIAHRYGIAHVGDRIHKTAKRLYEVDSLDDLFLSFVSEWDPAQVIQEHLKPNSNLSDTLSWPKIADDASKLMAVDSFTYLPDDILVKVDRAAMAASLETRAPFLDPAVVEFAWRLPTKYKIQNGTGKWLLRKVLYKYVPQELVDRPKMGFGVPLDDWLRGPLRAWADELLSPAKIRQQGLLDANVIQNVWRDHSTGRRSSGARLWSVLMLEAWLDEYC